MAFFCSIGPWIGMTWGTLTFYPLEYMAHNLSNEELILLGGFDDSLLVQTITTTMVQTWYHECYLMLPKAYEDDSSHLNFLFVKVFTILHPHVSISPKEHFKMSSWILFCRCNKTFCRHKTCQLTLHFLLHHLSWPWSRYKASSLLLGISGSSMFYLMIRMFLSHFVTSSRYIANTTTNAHSRRTPKQCPIL